MPDFMGGFFNKVKKIGSQVNQLESNVIGESKKFMEVFERNLILEREISERTDELSRANKSILTLNHIWKTMNSAEPLSEVLTTIVNGLVDDLGYLYALVFKIVQEKDGPVLKVKSSAKNEFSHKINEIIEVPGESFSIPLYEKENIMVNALETNQIQNIKNFTDLFIGFNPALEIDKIKALKELFMNRSISVLPIASPENKFGCLVAVSIRKETTDIEANFLSLFAGQIELAVTIAGLFEQVREQAITDGLTGLFNRRHFDVCLMSEVDRAKRLKQPFTLITLDMDRLKHVNDTFGHAAGDAAIIHIADVLKQNARSVDIPSRFGGEEFAIVLPGIDLDGGMIAAERLRAAIEATPVEGVGTITASIGVATFLKHSDSIDEILELADQAMYRAKRNGRNQVQIAEPAYQSNWKEQAVDAFIDILGKNSIPISPKTSHDLINQLKLASEQSKDAKDLLYFIVDSLTKTYDPTYQGGYAKEKMVISSKIAKELELSPEEIDKIKLATLLYDLGNMMMPENVLLKPGPLNEEEREKITEHPVIAAKEILKPIKSASHIISLVEHHHEHWDGSGYPAQLSGEDIPIGSRIILIVDSYYAMISNRPYRKALTHQEAIKTLKESANSKLDGKIVDLFISIIGKVREAGINK